MMCGKYELRRRAFEHVGFDSTSCKADRWGPMEEESWFRVRAVVDAAIDANDGPSPSEFRGPSSVPRSDRARAAVARLSAWDQAEVREACNALLDAVVSLERDFQRLHQQTQLNALGLELAPMLLGIGGDGATLPTPPRWPMGTQLRLWLDLPIRGHRTLLCAHVVVVPSTDADATELRFVDIGHDLRDLLFAFAFEQQARERRRDRDRAESS